VSVGSLVLKYIVGVMWWW